MLDISIVKKLTNKILKKEKVDSNNLIYDGSIYYMNRKKSTEYKFEIDNSTCEFCTFWKSNKLCCTKLVILGNSEIVIMFFKEDLKNDEKTKIYKFKSRMNFYELCCYLNGSIDRANIKDNVIIDWNLNKMSYVYS
jgi:hypothetical protein